MKYKFKLWNTDLYAFEELESQLNEMAESGYILMEASVDVPVAVYCKDETAKQIRYTVVPVRKDNEEFFQFCRDGGWEKKAYIRSGLCIFATTDPKANPIFSDPMTKYANAREMISGSTQAGCSIAAYVMLGMLLLGVTRVAGWLEVGMLTALVVIGWAAIAMGVGTMIANNRHMKKVEEKTDAELFDEKPSGMRIWNRFVLFCCLAIMLGMWGFRMVLDFYLEPNLISGLAGVAVPFLLAIGIYLRVCLKKPSIAMIFIFFGIWLFFGGTSVVGNLIG